MFCQYLYTILPYKMQILECFRSHLSIFLFPFSFHLGRGGQPLPVPPARYNFVVKNVFCQYLYTIEPYKIRILECFRSHLSIFLFPFSFHLGREGHPLPVPPGRYFGPRTMRTYFYNFVVTNVFCQYLYAI